MRKDINTKTGPKPDLVKIDINWEKAVGNALKKKPPQKKPSK
jgi:hypothetical protein